MVQRIIHPADVPAAEQQAPAHEPEVNGRTHFPSGTHLRFHAPCRKSGKNSSRFALCSKATTVGEFYELHPGSAGDAAKDLKNDLTRQTPLCATSGSTLTEVLRIAPPQPPKAARVERGGRSGRARAARVPSVKGVGADDPPTATEQELQRFVQHEKPGASTNPEEGDYAC